MRSNESDTFDTENGAFAVSVTEGVRPAMTVTSGTDWPLRILPSVPPATIVKVLITAVLIAVVVYLVSVKSDLPSLSSFVGGFSVRGLLLVFGFLLLGALLSAWRLKLIAGDLGYPLTAADAIAAIGLGQLAGSAFFQIVGQLMARGALLSRRGMPVAATVTMTVYERAAAAAVSLILAMGGGWYVFGRVTLDMRHGGPLFLKIIAGLLVAVAAGAWLAWGPKALSAARPGLDRRFILPVSRNIVASTVIQLATMAAYVTAAHAIAPAVPLPDLGAASAIVMLAASLPISLAGWGVRELSAIFALGVIGVPAQAALMVAVLIGVVSLLVVGLFAIVPFWNVPNRFAAVPMAVRTRTDYGSLLAWTVPLLAATAVCFQIYVPLGGGTQLNVNLADPLAVLGGALFVIGCVAQRRWPTWRLSGFNGHVVLMTLMLAAALLHGAAVFGWTPWAFTNRFFGWFILLGYGATGALLVRAGEREGFDLLLRTLGAVCAAIVALDLPLIAVARLGIALPADIMLARMQGFAQNPNAFSFQLLLALGATFVASFSRKQAVLIMTLCFCGLFFAGSRAAFLTLPIILGFAYAMRALPVGRVAASLVACAAVVGLILVLPALETAIASFGPSGNAWLLVPLAVDDSASNVQRMTSLAGGLRLFLDHPLLGGGLGAFMAEQMRDFGTPLVIHSTPLWLLAELGIVGFLIFFIPVTRIFFGEIKPARLGDPGARVLLLVIVVLGSMSQVHELLYQRSFWLLFGAALACAPAPAKAARNDRCAVFAGNAFVQAPSQ